MKKSMVVFLFLIFSVDGHSQVKSEMEPGNRYPAAIFIDSQQVHFSLIYLDPQNIDHISIIGGVDKQSKTDGKIFVTWRYPHPTFLTLADISIRYPYLKGLDILFIVDDSLISDTADIRFDPSFILQTRAFVSNELKIKSNSFGTIGIIIVQTKRSLQSGKRGDKQIQLQ
jgi:hypothetical protein